MSPTVFESMKHVFRHNFKSGLRGVLEIDMDDKEQVERYFGRFVWNMRPVESRDWPEMIPLLHHINQTVANTLNQGYFSKISINHTVKHVYHYRPFKKRKLFRIEHHLKPNHLTHRGSEPVG